MGCWHGQFQVLLGPKCWGDAPLELPCIFRRVGGLSEWSVCLETFHGGSRLHLSNYQKLEKINVLSADCHLY